MKGRARLEVYKVTPNRFLGVRVFLNGAFTRWYKRVTYPQVYQLEASYKYITEQGEVEVDWSAVKRDRLVDVDLMIDGTGREVKIIRRGL